jgi:hypothetical protein
MLSLRRIAVIVVIAAATVWFGITFGPVREVRADIYMNLASVYRENPDPPGKQGKQREGVTLMNSSKLHYRVSQSSQSVHQVLDDFEQAMTPKEFHLFSPKRFPEFQEVEKVAPQIPFLESLMQRTRFVRDESADWGYVSFLDLGPEANQDWHIQFKQKMAAFAKSRRLGDLGTARTVVAVPNPTSKSTTVMSYWTDPDFNLRDFEDHGGDLPGADVEGLPRIDPLRRILTFDHVEDRLGFMLVMYETPLPPDAAVEAFERKAGGAGWGTRLWRDPQHKQGEILFLRRGSAEVQIFAHRERGRSYVMVSRRNSTEKETNE